MRRLIVGAWAEAETRVAKQLDTISVDQGTAAPRSRALAHVQLLDAREVARVLAISMPTLWRYVKQERVPQPIRLGPRVLRWRLRDIERFVGVERVR